MKPVSFTLLLMLFIYGNSNAQTIANKKLLQTAEQSLSKYAYDIVNAEEITDRLRADSFFTKNLVQALKTPYSFNYAFDSLKTISRLYAPDSSFRIITWQLMKDFTYYRYKGAIQLKTPDGSLKLIPLYDGTDFTERPVDSVRTNENWIGALYYNIVLKKFNNKNYYTLIGYDENDARSTKKWLEVLTFDNNNKPLFGGRFFSYPNDPIKPPQPAYRFCLEFKKEANAKLNYDAEIDRIVFAKLVSETGEISKKHTLVPYGTIEGFRWELGKWIYIPNIEN
ncbi:MAG: hypothetical protein WCP74_11130 [Sphingobacteriia bacterium]|jgi:hypothetical protein